MHQLSILRFFLIWLPLRFASEYQIKLKLKHEKILVLFIAFNHYGYFKYLDFTFEERKMSKVRGANGAKLGKITKDEKVQLRDGK